MNVRTLASLLVCALAACKSSPSSHDAGGTGDMPAVLYDFAGDDLTGSPRDFSMPNSDGGSPPIGGFYVYQNDDGTGQFGLNALWDNDYSYGMGAMTYPNPGMSNSVVDYRDTTHVQAGHTYDLLIPKGVGWQPASTYYGGNPTGTGPFGIDISPYTYLVFDLWTTHPTDQFDSAWEYDGDVGSAQADQPAPAYVDDINTVPGMAALKSGAWNTQIKIPLAYFGHLGMKGCYKFFLRDNSNNDSYWDNVGFVAGSYSWIYDGGAASGWNTTSKTWNHDAATPLNGWSDESVSATANYAFDAGTLSELNGPSGLNGLLNPGQAIASTKVIALSVTANGGMWKVKNTAGFRLSPYTNLTFGLLPTNATHSYQVQLYDTTGTAVGSALNPSTYTNHDWGTNGQHWTIYVVPLSAFGTLPANIGALSIRDTSGLATNTIYISAPGFFN